MDGFQKTAPEEHDGVNGYCEPKCPQDAADVRWTPPQAESVGSDSCGATSVSEVADLKELKRRESEDEEEKEEEEAVPASKYPKRDQKKRRKEGEDQENSGNKQNSSASSSYTGKTFHSQDLLPTKQSEILTRYTWAEMLFFFICRPVPYLITFALRTAAFGPRGQHKLWDQCGV